MSDRDMWKRKTPMKKPAASARRRLVERLDRVFSRYIRLRDSFPTQGGRMVRCISCGRIIPLEACDCGHYINRGHMATRWDEDNCHAQCRQCNRFDEGNIQGYRPRLAAKIGAARVELLESRKHAPCRLTDFELEALLVHYRQRLKELEAGKDRL